MKLPTPIVAPGDTCNCPRPRGVGYKTINMDVPGWVVSCAAGKPMTELVSERIWSRMGAAQDAYSTIGALAPARAIDTSASLEAIALKDANGEFQIALSPEQ